MALIPLEKKMKKRIHKNIALAQDLIIIELYNNFPDTIIHGGTGIWRCYGSNRFSEDVDVYINPKYKEKKRTEAFLSSLRRRGFVVEKFKLSNNSIFSKFSYLNIVVSFEVLFKQIKDFVTKPFEMFDGTFITVYTLSPEDMISEKVLAYKKRRRVRDLYDIYFLLRFVETKEKIKTCLKKLLDDFKQPIDMKDLKVLIILGAIPNVEDMLNEVKKWAR